MKDMVSVIVPIYNTEKFLDDCLKSILEQTYQNLEIILVDDGSKDHSELIYTKYAKDERICILKQENQGASSARNLGLRKANGKYVYFFDSDDVMHKDAIERMVCCIEQENSDLVIADYVTINQESQLVTKIQVKKMYDTDSSVFDFVSFEPFPGNKLYRIDIIHDYNIVWDNARIGEDMGFYLKYLLFCKKISKLEYPVFSYRIVENSLSRNYSLKILEIIDAFQMVQKFYDQNQSNDLYLKYINPLKLLQYYYQVCKIKFFQNRSDRKRINDILKKELKKLKVYKNQNSFLHQIYMKYRIKNFYYSLR